MFVPHGVGKSVRKEKSYFCLEVDTAGVKRLPNKENRDLVWDDPIFLLFLVEKIFVDAVKHNFSLESDGLRDHLACFAEHLNMARQMIHPPHRKQSKFGALRPSLT
ncbi:eukaryotic translation initiation factor 3 subunit A [Senna tora]|uniref:Eukaryotic translation initiation factor 3 subunit A n=1 Tax=Senna tora TaxID=362788 RepID=A0A834TA08_9FABA|nr:eukaryotic translation initiation factor 3 subunit A [Senna tora]